jgi:hypothetical protein
MKWELQLLFDIWVLVTIIILIMSITHLRDTKKDK